MDGERNHTSRLNEPFVTVRPPPIDITSLAVKGASIHYIRPEEGGGIKRYSKFADKHYINSADRGGGKNSKNVVYVIYGWISPKLVVPRSLPSPRQFQRW